MLKITRFNHAGVNAFEKLDQCKKFYTEFLGLKETPRTLPPKDDKQYPGFWLQLNEVQLHIMGVELDGSLRNPFDIHFSLYVESIADARIALEEQGIEIRDFGVGEGLEERIWFLDPAGNSIEIQQDPQLV